MKNKILGLMAGMFFASTVFAASQNTITPPAAAAVINQISSSGANLSWKAATDSNASATITYAFTLTKDGATVPGATIKQTGDGEATITGLAPAVMYQLVITAKDNTGASVNYAPVWVLSKAAASYLRLSVPASQTFPVYLYQQQANGTLNQLAYIAGSSQLVYLGSYDATTSGNYQLYYSNSASPSGYDYCTISIAAGKVVSSINQCPGLGAPTAITALPETIYDRSLYVQPNVYTLGLAAQAWSRAPLAPPTPQPTNYKQARTMTFVNNTQYQAIKIDEGCTVSANPNNPNCKNATLFTIPQGKSKVFTVDDPAQEGESFPAGLISSSFYVSAYEDSHGKWVETGGYGFLQTAYATLMEATWQGFSNDPNGSGIRWIQEDNIDASTVDGYNFGVRIYPQFPTYCKATIGGKNTNAEGDDLYSEQNPITQLVPQNNESLQDLCNSSSQLQSGQKSGAWSLAKLSKSGDFQGCYSPCQYATINHLPSADEYCCHGAFGGWQSCDAAGFANNSSYVTNMNPPISQGVYRFAYDDATGDFGCPDMTNYVVSVVSGAMNTITLGNSPLLNQITETSAQVSGYTATDSNASAILSYAVRLSYAGQPAVPVPGADITYSGLGNTTASITGLVPNTTYQATVIAQDNEGASAAFQPITFTTTNGPSYALSFTSVTSADVKDSSATVNWAVSDNDPKKGVITYTYTINAVAQPSTTAMSVNLTGLTANTLYTVAIKAADADHHTATSLPVIFTTKAAPPPPSSSWVTVGYNGKGERADATEAQAFWSLAQVPGARSFVASAVGTNGSVAAVGPIRGPNGGKYQVRFLRLTPAQYTVTITAYSGDGPNSPVVAVGHATINAN
ncbi:MAG: hypothetical protein NTU49_08190 [Gammaproteobacteria bacterium]|nr:hypothetical protein [Gammaproteobacteria bacterium]